MVQPAQANTYLFGRPHGSTTASYLIPLSVLDMQAAEYDFALSPNWDGEGAKAVTRQVVNLARRIVDKYGSPRSLQEVAPGKDGSLSFIWKDGAGNYTYLDVGPGDSLHLYYEQAGGLTWEGVSVASDPKILEQLAQAFQFVRPSPVVDRPAIYFVSHSSSDTLALRPLAA